MSGIGTLSGALIEGVILGAIFFGGLWWTVRYGLISLHPALWFALSTLVRMGVIFAGLYWATRSGLFNLLVCLLGIFIARVTVTCLAHSTPHDSTPRERLSG
jgi:F1F0 ATPase subunit 2